MRPNTDTQNIIDQLKQASGNGLSFEEAKKQLISKGYSDESINQATDDYQYGSKQISDIPSNVTKYFEQHPGQAVQDGSDLLIAKDKEQASDDQMKATVDFVASDVAPDLQSQVRYESDFAHDVGLSWGLLSLIVLVINIIVYFLVGWLDISQWFYVINGILTLAMAIFLIKRIK